MFYIVHILAGAVIAKFFPNILLIIILGLISRFLIDAIPHRDSLIDRDSFKKFYKVKYCTGCELEKTDSELENGRCPIHPNRDLEIREEENYFFRFSNYTQKLKDFYEAEPTFVVPDFRFNEVKAFVGRGLEDFSISRLKTKMPWGVGVPGDDEHVMYVWFDALVNYISATGWPACAEASAGRPGGRCSTSGLAM